VDSEFDKAARDFIVMYVGYFVVNFMLKQKEVGESLFSLGR